MSETIDEKIGKLQTQFIDHIKTTKKDIKDLRDKIEKLDSILRLRKIDKEQKDKTFYTEFVDFKTDLRDKIEELEQKLDSHINDFQLALRKIIYKHINTQGDEYGKDIEELLRMMDGFKWQKKKDAEKSRENSLQEWKRIFFVLGEGECEFYREDATCKRADNGTKKYGCNEIWCERKIRVMEKKEDNEAKKPYKCRIMGIECLFPKINCSECIVNKEYHIGCCPETQKLIEKYKKDREATVSRSTTNNNKKEEILKK